MDDIATNAGGNVVGDVAKGIFQEAKRHIRYVIIYKKNVEKFYEKLEMLNAKRKAVQQEIDVAKKNLGEIMVDVELWCKRVDEKMEEKKKKIKDLEDKVKNKCLVKFRYQLSKLTEESTITFDDLLQQGHNFDRVSCPAPLPNIVDGTPKDFEVFKSRETMFNNVMLVLKDATINVIGVYGIAGVGKTTLVNEVARQALKDNLFDSMAIAVVTQNPDIQNIQDQLAESLGLKLEEKTSLVRAARLRERLKQEKSVLVVLDDIWKKLDLKKVGIPSGDESKGCNLLLVSRDLNVLRDKMDAQQNFKIDVLEDKEAWDMFKKIVGDNVESSELKSTATEVAKKCAGLPIAVATVGKALRNKELYVWNDALRKLQRPSPTNFKGIPSGVYTAIELSYNHLETEEHKKTFLLCCLLGHNVAIRELLKYTMALRIFHGVKTVKETRERLLTLVSDLKDSCLLHKSYNSELFAMHDLIYDVALAIASRDNKAFTLKKGEVLKDWPDEDTLKTCSMISLRYATISGFPEGLKFPQLAIFQLFNNDSSMKIPNSFFKEMKNLQVLRLTRMHFSSLPSSINLLTNLRMLCLNICLLEDISLIGELKTLETLSLKGSNIKMLPKEVGQLIKLKFLDLSYCTKLETIPPGLLSSLSNLEELRMTKSFAHWEEERQANASLVELKALSYLTSLNVQIFNPKIIPKDLFPGKLERYKILVGDQAWNQYVNIECSRRLSLKLNTSFHHLDHGIKRLLKDTEVLYLYLDELKGARIVIDELYDGDFFRCLKDLNVQNGLKIQYIINDNDAVDKIEFLKLQSLTLQDLPELISFCSKNEWGFASMPQNELPLFSRKMVYPCLEYLHLSSINVERIWHKQLPKEYDFTLNLRILIIMGCNNLKQLISFTMVRCLPHLKFFKIVDCKCLREIIFTEDIEEEIKATISFPQLNSLIIKNVQHFIGFCSENYKIEFPSLKILEIEQCPRLRGFIHKYKMDEDQAAAPSILFDEKMVFPCLNDLKLSSINNVERIWHKQLSNNYDFTLNLTSLIIKGCNSLKHLLSSSMARCLACLKNFEIVYCKCLREIIFTEERVKEENKATILFPQLNSLTIMNVQHLIGFSSETYNIEFPSLKFLKIEQCPLLRRFIHKCEMEEDQLVSPPILFDEKVSFPSLQRLIIHKLKNMKMIWNNQTSLSSFCKLEKLVIKHCNELFTVFPFDRLGRFQQLQTLHVINCASVEHIFEIQESHMKEKHPICTQLRELRCHNLSQLKTIWNKNPQGILKFLNLRIVFVAYCWNLKYVFPTSVARFLEQLKDLTVDRCGVEEIVSKEEGRETTIINFEFNKLSSLSLKDLPKLKCFYPGKHTTKWPMLKKLRTFHCYNVKMLDMKMKSHTLPKDGGLEATMTPPLLLVEQVIPKLEQVSLTSDDISRICDSKVSEDLFHDIKVLNLLCYHDESTFFPTNFVERFHKLEMLEVTCCNFKDLQFSYERDAGKGSNSQPFLPIRNLKLNYLGYLENLWMQGLSLGHILPNLESLEVLGCNRMVSLGLPSTSNFENLTTLDVWQCEVMVNLVTSVSIQNLVQLKKLKIRYCGSMKKVVGNEGDDGGATYDIITFKRLKYMQLLHLPRLKSFCSSNHTFKFPYLDQVIVSNCPELKIFCNGDLHTPILRGVEEIGNDIKKVHWNGDLNRTILQLYKKKVDYEGIQHLVLFEFSKAIRIWKDNLQNRLDLKILQYLEVYDCKSLTYVLTTSMALDLVQLKKLIVKNCPMMKQVIKHNGEEEMANTIMLTLLWSIIIESCSNLTSFYLGNNTVEGPTLFRLEVKDCPKMAAFASSPGENTGIAIPFLSHKVVCPNLELLALTSLNTQRIWHDQQLSSQAENLIRLDVEGCNNLRSLFSSSMVQCLVLLETLTIKDCQNMEEVIFLQGLPKEEATSFVFPRLKKLELHMLPNLKSFYFKSHTAQWPLLQKILIYRCNKVEVFASESLSYHNESTNQALLFWVNEVTFPKLEEVRLEKNDAMKVIWHGEHRPEFFSRLKVLELITYPESVVFPHCFVQSLPNLKKLVVNDSPFYEIFNLEGFDGEENHALALTSLNELRLSELSDLRHLWKEEFHFEQAFCELRTLEVFGCDKLEILVPSLVSFKNLTTLEVLNCHGLVNLVACSTAKTLVQLKKMSIIDCKMIEKIISSKKDYDVEGGIIFSHLQYLQLSCLPSLESFCSGDHIFEFPSLEKVIVIECPKLKTFCQGDLSAPKLQKVLLTEFEDEENCMWHGDLKSTIEHLCK